MLFPPLLKNPKRDFAVAWCVKSYPNHRCGFCAFLYFDPLDLRFLWWMVLGSPSYPPLHIGGGSMWCLCGNIQVDPIVIVCGVISYPLQKTSPWLSNLMCSFQALLACDSWMPFLATENLQHNVIWSDLISPWEFTVLSAIPEEFFVKRAVFMPSSGLCYWILLLSFCHHWVWDLMSPTFDLIMPAFKSLAPQSTIWSVLILLLPHWERLDS
jgi:hypothetical protein